MVTYDNKTVTIGILLQKQTKKLNNMQIFHFISNILILYTLYGFIDFSYKFFNSFLFHAYKNPAVLSGGIKIFNFST